MKSSYIMRLNNLDDWYVVKVSVNQTCFETYIESNNSKIVCCIISPSYWSFNKWQLFISNTDEFDGQWHKSPIQLMFTEFSELKDYINRINTEEKLKITDKGIYWMSFKENV